MVNVCALRCIGKENREKQFHKSEFRRERERGEGTKMKDNKNELNADVESQHAKSDISLIFFFFKKVFYKMISVQPLVCFGKKMSL